MLFKAAMHVSKLGTFTCKGLAQHSPEKNPVYFVGLLSNQKSHIPRSIKYLASDIQL
jgi:hypothetical protein